MHTFIERGTRISTVIASDGQSELVRWTTWGNGPDIQQSYALISAEGTVLVDPIRPIGQNTVARFEKYCCCDKIGIVCTNPNHERNVYWFRENYGAPIFVPKCSASEFEGKPNHLYEDGDILPGCVRALALGDSGEMVLHWQPQEAHES